MVAGHDLARALLMPDNATQDFLWLDGAMSEFDEKFPNWNKPATKGDVLTAMIWTQSLVGHVFTLAIAARSSDPAEFSKAADEYGREWKDFRRKMTEIAGGPIDD